MRLRLDTCVVDLDLLEVSRGTEVTSLTPMESRLLRYLAGRRGEPADQYQLLEAVWGYSPRTLSRTVSTTISRLRAKIEADPGKPLHLITVKGEGYRLRVPRSEREHALPPMIGREEDLAELCRRVDSSPLVTIVGPPGVGKTRLLRELDWTLTETGQDGVFVDLAAVESLAGALARIASALGVQAGTEVALLDALRSGAGRVLLLDNVEQLCSALASPLRQWREFPGLRVVCTSRVAVGVPLEVVQSLAPLDLDSAARLLDHMARRVQGTGLESGPTLRRLLDQLGGLPLAIELTVGWIPMLGLEDLTERVCAGGVLDLRDSGVNRFESLRAAIQTSWDLFRTEQRALLVQLAVFRGAFSVREAEAVVRGDGLLDALAQFVGLGWLVRREATMHFLPPIHAFLGDALAGDRARPEIAERHRRWCESLETVGLHRVADLRAAADDILLSDPRRAARLALACASVLAGPVELAWDEQIYARLEPRHGEAMVGIALRLADLHLQSARLEQSAARAAEALIVAEDLGGAMLCRSLTAVGRARVNGAEGDVVAVLERAVDVAGSVRDDALRATPLELLARHHRYQGRFEQSLDAITSAGILRERIGASVPLAECMMTKGNLHVSRHELPAAEAAFRRALVLEPGPRLEALTRGYLAQVFMAGGRIDEAVQALGEALEFFRLRGMRWDEAVIRVRLADAYSHLDQAQQAFKLLTEASRLAALLDAPRLQAGIAHAFAVLHLTELELPSARGHAAYALGCWRALKEKRHVAILLGTCAQIEHADGCLSEADALYAEAVALWDALEIREGEAATCRAWWAACLVEAAALERAEGVARAIGSVQEVRDPAALAAIAMIPAFFDPTVSPPVASTPLIGVLLTCLRRTHP